jgi:GT2 family glycosyltransferase
LPDISILIVSFNTRDILRECLQSIPPSRPGLEIEIIVIDNCSRDGSLDMVASEFPSVKRIASETNLGFGNANNRAFTEAQGRYIVLLNSDAFLRPDTLEVSLRGMEADSTVGLAGGRLVGRDGKLQPSARMFPNLTRQVLVMLGWADKYPRSKFFGQADRTWADPMQPAEVDWVPGAYSIIRTDLIRKIGFFDPAFFLYYEEVDLCRRIKDAGYKVMFWPEIEVVHIGGESSRQVKTLEMSKSGAQLVLWEMRSTFLFYRKHMPMRTAAVRWLKAVFHRLRVLSNRRKTGTEARMLENEQRHVVQLIDQAWRETDGGRKSPPQPW